MITIQIDPNLHSKSVKELAGALVLALLGELEENAIEETFNSTMKEALSELSPEAAFLPGPAANTPISTVGPHLVIPNPPPPANIVSGAASGTTVASPSAPPVPPAAPSTIQFDGTGLPWDARIHASSKTQNADKTWRGKRGVSAELVAGVEAELRKLMAIPAPIPSLAPSATIPPPPPPSSAPSVPTADAQVEYVALVMQVAALVGANRLSNEQLQKCFQAVGITQMQDLGIRLDLLPTLLET